MISCDYIVNNVDHQLVDIEVRSREGFMARWRVYRRKLKPHFGSNGWVATLEPHVGSDVWVATLATFNLRFDNPRRSTID